MKIKYGSFIETFITLLTGLLIGIGLVMLVGCEKGIICTQEFRSYYMHPKDTLEYITVVDIDNGNILYNDSNVYKEFKVVDDSYLNIMGTNQQATLNIKFRYVNDSVHLRVYPICISTDECHVYNYNPNDTLK